MASGLFVPISISKTVFGPSPEMPSTAIPIAVRSSARRRSSEGNSTKSRIHCAESFIWSHRPSAISAETLRADGLYKLLQKPDITLEKQLQIIEAVLQHGDPVHAHAEREAGNFLRVIAVLLHEFKDIWIDHAAAENLDPSRLLAGTAWRIIRTAFAAATGYETRDEHLRARLGERKERRPKASLHI